jgi:hypothetical protein
MRLPRRLIESITHAPITAILHHTATAHCSSVLGAGTITTQLPFGALPPGTYTVGFTIIDQGGLSGSYGPGSLPMPGSAPLTFTVS